MNRWFRVYDDLVDDPKVQRLAGETVKSLLNLWCLASQNDGMLPAADDIAFKLRMTPAKVAKLLSVLGECGLIDSDEDGLRPHNWNARQYKSDVTDPTAALRQKAYRERNQNRNGDRNATVTVTDTRTDTDTDTEQNRTDARTDLQKRVGNFRQAIVKAFEDANSPTVVETSRAELWLTQGYQEDICLAVIAGLVRKKPSITTLNYFDNAIKDAHASKAPERQAVPMTGEQTDWDAILTTYKKIGHWSKWAGPDLTSPACRAPRELLEKYGLLADGRTVN